MDQITGAVVGDIKSQVARDPSIMTNLLRYGIPSSNSFKSAGFLISAAGNGVATVTAIAPWGTAGCAGLQRNDQILTLNGHPVGGCSQGQIDELSQRETPGDKWDLLIGTADGKTASVRFESQDIRWYLDHLAGSQ